VKRILSATRRHKPGNIAKRNRSVEHAAGAVEARLK
jgi:hypothetical protein